MRSCHVCGGDFAVDGNGIANHLDDDGDIDHDVDADHVPYSLDETPILEPVYLDRRALATVLAAPTEIRVPLPRANRDGTLGRKRR
jgi:hypothetical protein